MNNDGFDYFDTYNEDLKKTSFLGAFLPDDYIADANFHLAADGDPHLIETFERMTLPEYTLHQCIQRARNVAGWLMRKREEEIR